jgi:hypothetical protein
MGIISKFPASGKPQKKVNGYAIAFAAMSLIMLGLNIAILAENKKLREPKQYRSFVKNTVTGRVNIANSNGEVVAWFYDSVGGIMHHCPDTILIHNNKDTFLASDFRELIK